MSNQVGGDMFGQDNNKDEGANPPISNKPVNNGLLGIDDDNDDVVSSTVSGSQSVSTPTVQPSSTPPIPDTPTISVTDEPKESISPESTNNTPSSSTAFSPVDDPYSTPPAYAQNSITNTQTTTDDLANIKRQALQDLTPLINHLDQNAEEKFKTTMMMIQASDDKDLIPKAYESAKDISDEKKRAQALLDIVNEINYFTHKTEE